MNGYTLEDGEEDDGDSQADDKVVAPFEDAAELHNGEDTVLEEDAAAQCWSDMPIWMCMCLSSRTGDGRSEAYMEYFTDDMASV